MSGDSREALHELLRQTDRVFAWVDGRAVLVIGTVPPRTLAIQL